MIFRENMIVHKENWMRWKDYAFEVLNKYNLCIRLRGFHIDFPQAIFAIQLIF